MEFHTTEDKLHCEKAGGEDLGKVHSTQREGEHRSSCTAHSVPMPSIMSYSNRGCQWSGSGRTFFSNAIQLTIIPQWIFPFTVVSVTLIWFPAQQDTNDLTKTKMAPEASVGPSLTSNKWRQVYNKPETLQNRRPAEFTNLRSAGGGCCYT